MTAGQALPIVARGGTIWSRGSDNTFERKVAIRIPGVYLLWIRAQGRRLAPALAKVEFGESQPLKGSRLHFLVPKAKGSVWVNLTRDPFLKLMVHVPRGGTHPIRVTCLSGASGRPLIIEALALTPSSAARPRGDTLDHSFDPGAGRARPARAKWTRAGYQPARTFPIRNRRRTFHVDSARGDDRETGRSPGTAWRSFSNVSGRHFQPGDAILLRRGGRWLGSCSPRGDGTAAQPIVIGAYGKGPKPLINGIDREAVLLTDLSHWVVQDLTVTTEPAYERSGVRVLRTKGHPQPRGICIRSVSSFDNGGKGIDIGGDGFAENGFRDVLIENCEAGFNLAEGITVHGTDQDGSRNVAIRNCSVFSNGNGIWIHGVAHGLIEGCRSSGNATNVYVWNARNIVVRRTEAFRGGDGVNIDWACADCVVEDCFVHDTQGLGYNLRGVGVGTYRGRRMQNDRTTVRGCAAERTNGGIELHETVCDARIEHNRFAAIGFRRDPRPAWNAYACALTGTPLIRNVMHGGYPRNTLVSRNVFRTMGRALMLWLEGDATNQGNRLTDNSFLTEHGGPPVMLWGGSRSYKKKVITWGGAPVRGARPAVLRSVAALERRLAEKR